MFNLFLNADRSGTTFLLIFGMALVALVIAVLLSSDLATKKHKYSLKASYLVFGAFIVLVVTTSVSALAQLQQPTSWEFVSVDYCDCSCDPSQQDAD